MISTALMILGLCNPTKYPCTRNDFGQAEQDIISKLVEHNLLIETGSNLVTTMIGLNFRDDANALMRKYFND